jgi:hypothetical protein
MYAENKSEKNIVPQKEGEIEKKMTDILNQFILKEPKIKELYAQKRKYIEENSVLETDIPAEIDVSNKWVHFMPPTFTFQIPAASLQTVSPKEISSIEVMNVFRVKNIMFSLAVLEYIRDIVAQKNVLFQTKSGYPFLINACCDDQIRTPSINTIQYFSEEDAAIKNYVSFLWKISERLDKIQSGMKASMLVKEHHMREKQVVSIETEKMEKSQRNMYLSFDTRVCYEAMIFYGKFDFEIYPIPKDLTEMFPEKPKGTSDELYDSKSSLESKIEFLSHHRFKMDVKKLIHLMNIIHIRNHVEIPYSMDISYKSRLFSAIEHFEIQNQDVFGKSLIHSLFSLDKSSASEEKKEESGENMKKTGDAKKIEESEEDAKSEQPENEENEEESSHHLKRLHDVLQNKNKMMKEEIMKNIYKNNSESISERGLANVFKIIYDWGNFEGVPISNVTQYTKSIIYLLGILYPSFIVSEPVEDKTRICKHWGLLPEDEYYLNNKLNQNEFSLESYKKDPLLMPILNEIISNRSIRSLYTFLDFCSLFIKKHQKKGTENRNVYHELYMFCIHSILMLYFELVNHRTIFKTIMREINTEFRNKQNDLMFENNMNSDLALNEIDPEIEEIDIVQADNKEDILRKISDLVLAMVRTLKTGKQINAKEPAMMSYSEIMAKIDYSRDREKQNIKKHFKEMTTEERKAEIIHKKLHLGQFFVDIKKINKYGENEKLFGQEDEGEEDIEEQEAELIRMDTEELLYGEPVDEDRADYEDREEEDFDDINENVFEDMGDGDGNSNYY